MEAYLYICQFPYFSFIKYPKNLDLYTEIYANYFNAAFALNGLGEVDQSLAQHITRFIEYWFFFFIGTLEALIYETPIDSDEDFKEKLSVHCCNSLWNT